jgi:ATP synthase F1 complex assembly factor 2
MSSSRRAFSTLQRKRFYQDVGINRSGSGWNVTLDAKPIKTPARDNLLLPSEAIAWGIATEFESQRDVIVPATMPLMTIASTAIDVTRSDIHASVDRIVKFLETDTVCFLHEDEPELQRMQREAWDPLRKLVAENLGVITHQTAGISLHSGQSSVGVYAIQSTLKSLDFWRLTTMEVSASSAKSAVIALALLNGYASVQQAVDAALVEEKWQRQNWGTVEGCHDISERETAMWLAACSFFDEALL